MVQPAVPMEGESIALPSSRDSDDGTAVALGMEAPEGERLGGEAGSTDLSAPTNLGQVFFAQTQSKLNELRGANGVFSSDHGRTNGKASGGGASNGPTQTATTQRLTRSTLRRNRGFPTRPRLTPTTRRPGRTRRGSQCPRGRPRPRSRSSATTTSTAKAPRDRPVTATTSAINPGATLRKPGPGPPSPRRVHPCAEGSTLGSSCPRPSAWRPSWMEALGRAPRLSA